MVHITQFSPKQVFRWKIVLLTLVLSFMLAGIGIQSTQAVNLASADGVWLSAVGVDGNPPNCLFIENTPAIGDENLLTYGSAVASGRCPSVSMTQIQSGFGFQGNGSLDFDPGATFLLGEFTHYNNPLYSFNNMEFARLGIDLNFTDPNISTRVNYQAQLDETPNSQATCPYGDSVPCADRVDLVPSVVDQTFVIDGVYYILEIIGFVPGELETCTFSAGNVIDGFISEENDSNSACLFAQFNVAEPTLEIEKSGTSGPVSVGTLVEYEIVVSNPSIVTLTNVSVVDPMLNLTRSLGQLDPGEEIRIVDEYRVQASDLPGPLINTATADSAETDSVSDSHRIDLLELDSSIRVTKIVNWNEMAPNQTQLFRICITGPSYPGGDCANVNYDGGILEWDDLEAGTYTVSETHPGQDWSVTNQTSTINLAAGANESVIIINEYSAPGSLSVLKVVDWGDAPVDSNASFSICAQGPSYPTPACQSIGASGGTLVWSNLVPGVYVVTETPPANWSVSGSGAEVFVPRGGNGATQLTNTYTFVPPPPPEQCDDPDPARDLIGYLLPESGFSTGRVINSSDICSYDIGIASYLKFDEVIDNQVLHSATPGTIGPGQTVDISVAMPECAVQVDLFYGPVLQSLFQARYGDRLLAATHLPGNGFCIAN